MLKGYDGHTCAPVSPRCVAHSAFMKTSRDSRCRGLRFRWFRTSYMSAVLQRKGSDTPLFTLLPCYLALQGFIARNLAGFCLVRRTRGTATNRRQPGFLSYSFRAHSYLYAYAIYRSLYPYFDSEIMALCSVFEGGFPVQLLHLGPG